MATQQKKKTTTPVTKTTAAAKRETESAAEKNASKTTSVKAKAAEATSKQSDSSQDIEERRTRLKALILLGKERGYLTFAEINDHLPDMLEVEQVEGVVSMINDMGISVCDVAPDSESMVMNEVAPPVADDDAAAEAEAAISTVDSEFGRTTDPVRMYMREMGVVNLLTRQDEIEIAKRIEDGLKHMIMAISACPATIAEILLLAQKIANDEMRVEELIRALHRAPCRPGGDRGRCCRASSSAAASWRRKSNPRGRHDRS
jgi:RNA polymerase primary sigma factor